MSMFRTEPKVYLLGALQKPGQPRMATKLGWIKRLFLRRKRANVAKLRIARGLRQ